MSDVDFATEPLLGALRSVVEIVSAGTADDERVDVVRRRTGLAVVASSPRSVDVDRFDAGDLCELLAITSGGPNAMIASWVSGPRYGLVGFAVSSFVRPMVVTDSRSASWSRRTSFATVWYGCAVLAVSSSIVHCRDGSARVRASSSPWR